MSAQDAEILRRARARIEDPSRWTQTGHYAVNDEGVSVGPSDASATCWCASGAVYAETGDGDRYGTARNGRLRGLLREAAWNLTGGVEAPGCHNHIWINDHTDHSTVLRLFDRAIELAEADA